ncbi:excinuclease ABC subunit UvrB [Candidatus Hepatobacter penaei]|uniref:excinuclease ABC subunit UvrB n=1 Tax=Candidatus Hepatobacter penaei TaxID=1274402 RepID=UPI0006961183
MTFAIHSPFQPTGDQPAAIAALVDALKRKQRNHTLLGVTGSGKTFTMAHVIQETQRPTLILAPNKTLAAQLYAEMKALFPHNAVEYFVSYYDYYQPEAFIPRTGTYIEKEATINEHIDRMRHSATRSLLERDDVIVVASVSCIYGIGSPESYRSMVCKIDKTLPFARETTIQKLVELQYTRNDMVLKRGTFRLRGDILDVFPSHYEDRAWRISFFEDEIESIVEIDPLLGTKGETLDHITIYPNSHYVIPGPTRVQAVKHIKADLAVRLEELRHANKLVEAQRLDERTRFDLESIATMGSCPGIENYSRYLTGRKPGEPPPTLFEYLPGHALLMIDESHVTLPQLRAMYRGDASRKKTLSDHGFRLPSCADNRPLMFEEWEAMRPDTIFVSATPGPFELEMTGGEVVEQVIRPTGLVDPVCEVRPTHDQIDDLIQEIRQTTRRHERVLITTLTKKMAETLQDYFTEMGLKSRYIHSDVDTLERIDIIQKLRKGDFDILVGINLLREGLDIPECSLVAIIDADKEGFLRSKTSLIQTIGRAARHIHGKVILYGDVITPSMRDALEETARRRAKQMAYNKKHNITPQGVKKELSDILAAVYNKDASQEVKKPAPTFTSAKAKKAHLHKLEKDMLEAASCLDFEKAARLRDQLSLLEKQDLL